MPILSDTVQTLRLLALAAAEGHDLTRGIYTGRIGQHDRVSLAEGLRSIEGDLAELATTSADVSAIGQPTPGRGPIALALNQARTEIAGAAACARMAESAAQPLAMVALAQVAARLTVGAAFADRALSAGSTVGTG